MKKYEVEAFLGDKVEFHSDGGDYITLALNTTGRGIQEAMNDGNADEFVILGRDQVRALRKALKKAVAE